MPKAFLIDTTRCTACRGCQVACKEWHNLPAVETKQRGTHQNPADLTPFNYKLVRFSEHLIDGVVKWYFFPDQCRHCLAPPCVQVAEDYAPGAMIQDDETGAIIYTDQTARLSAEEFEEIRESCPYDIPRRDTATGRVTKCDMCIDRVKNNLKPMCVTTCAMGAMEFGERDDMLRLAEKRLATVKKEFPRASLANPDDVNVIYLLADEPERLHKYAIASGLGKMSRKDLFARLARPLTRLG
ncbi:4Fe-4S dicluster domain-containing protein [Desulfovibrio ferrophilus]|uniref:Formate dehydrogenase subunit beta n=1 Tax=Desulfovibrio ferrophilus TaxID=241368 RepID=A0A2Z6AXW2_9BACT|nr:4Fe-4S dicluster domain-containing protein [Desulfovibrio ferrophilus]BBD08079.1 formate dehydrogenase subunit beta [Desulfovibrio ferrophilus]